jgi:acyl carrier protein
MALATFGTRGAGVAAAVLTESREPMSLRDTIFATMQQVAAEQQLSVQPFRDDLALVDSGLDSLSFAIIVARLEDEVGLDPFTASEDAYFPITFGEFVGFYDAAVR